MIGLNNEYKIELAKQFTTLAIQNNLITTYSESEDTAKEVTKFYRTIYETLDTDSTT